MKLCRKCQQWLDEGRFYRDSSRKDGLMGVCKACHDAYTEARRKVDPKAKIRARIQAKRYARQHPEKVLEKNRRYYHERGGKEKNRAWKERNWNKIRRGVIVSKRRHPLENKARYALRNAIRQGKVKKPNRCQECGKKGAKLEAHHWLGYDMRNWLNVIWLCEDCHGKTTRK